jgi:hypothetical protein
MAHSEKKWTLGKCVLQTKESLNQCYTELVDVSIGGELDNASQKREQVIIKRLNDQAVIHPCSPSRWRWLSLQGLAIAPSPIIPEIAVFSMQSQTTFGSVLLPGNVL